MEWKAEIRKLIREYFYNFLASKLDQKGSFRHKMPDHGYEWEPLF